jgi:hypothetical protein
VKTNGEWGGQQRTAACRKARPSTVLSPVRALAAIGLLLFPSTSLAQDRAENAPSGRERSGSATGPAERSRDGGWALGREREEDAWSAVDRLDLESFERDGLGSYHGSRDDLQDQERNFEALRGEIDQYLMGASVRGASLDELVVPASGQLIRLGPARMVDEWAVRGFLAQKVAYNDNFFQIADDEEDDVSSSTTIGARVSRVGASMVVDATVAGTVEGHLDYPEENAVSGYFRGGAQWTFGRWYARLIDIYSERYASLVVDVNVRTTATVIQTVAYDRVRPKSNLLGGAIGHRWEKLTSELRYEVTDWEYGRLAEGLDAAQQHLYLGNHYRLTPRLGVSLDLDARLLEYEQNLNNDSDAYGAHVGWSLLASEKVRTYGRLGYIVQDSDSSGKIPESQDYSGPSWLAGARWNTTPKVDSVFTYSGDIYRAVGANFQHTQVIGGRVEWRFAPLWRLDAKTSVQLSDVSRGEDFSIRSHGLRLGWLAGENLEVAMEWNYAARASGVRNGDFKSNEVSLQFTVHF